MDVRTVLASGLAGLVVLGTACGGGSSPGASAQSPRRSASLAFAACMRSHGVPSFPDPNAQGDFPSFQAGVAKQASVAADERCKHLVPRGSSGSPQQRRQKLDFALRVARCLRAHGYPTFPDPTASGQSIPPGIDAQSRQFERAESGCERQAGEALHLP
ncbi:MAG TPA: hypothetical protein VFA97_11325 [Gaiellaceae bacterium]|nr:hypothetical protein [Gaiellaceae bacterium]